MRILVDEFGCDILPVVERAGLYAGGAPVGIQGRGYVQSKTIVR